MEDRVPGEWDILTTMSVLILLSKALLDYSGSRRGHNYDE